VGSAAARILIPKRMPSAGFVRTRREVGATARQPRAWRRLRLGQLRDPRHVSHPTAPRSLACCVRPPTSPKHGPRARGFRQGETAQRITAGSPGSALTRS